MYSLSDAVTYKWEPLYSLKLENEFGIKAFRRLIGTLEDSLQETMKKFQDELQADEDLKEMRNKGTSGSYYAAFYEYEERTIKELQKQQRFGLCLSLFSFFEGRLKTICTKLEGALNNKIKIEDLRGDDLVKYQIYMQKVVGLDLTSLEKHFTPINNQKKVRNILAHQDGTGRKDQKSQINAAAGLSLDEFGDFFQVNINDKVYLDDLLQNMENYLENIIPLIDTQFKTT